ncbi:MAG: Gfo/Idh/MocA family oxidoreductase [Gilvibacter sp.]
MNEIKLAIIGPGKIAHKFAADVPLVKGVVLFAVASRNLDKAKAFAAEHKATHYYDNYEAVAANSEVDLVYIATPNSFHFEHSMMCLEAGKAVICEKPFALNSQQVLKMTNKAQEKGVFFMEALWTRFIPATQKVIELIAQGAIGEIKGVKADFGFTAPVDLDSRLYNKALGGGSLLDIGIYPIYLSYLLLGVPESIHATATLSPTGVDTDCKMVFEYSNAISNLECSFTQTTPTEALILGSKGMIKLHSRFHHCKGLTVITEGQPPVSIKLDYIGYGYSYELAHVVDCLHQDTLESPMVSHTDSINLMSLLDTVRNIIEVKFDQDVL